LLHLNTGLVRVNMNREDKSNLHKNI